MFLKTMLKQKVQNISSMKYIQRTLVAVLLLVFAAGFLTTPLVKATTVNDQINALQQENASNRNQVVQLRDQATSYQDAVNKLQASISTLQAQINANTAEQTRLQGEITAAEVELAKQKKLLGENIKAMYLEGQITTLEMLASSKDLSDFVDKDQYRNNVKDKIKGTLDKVTALKVQLKEQKQQIESLLAEQKTQQASLEANRMEQSNLLAYNQSQQADFNQKTKDNQKKIDELIASQRRANFNPDGGPWLQSRGIPIPQRRLWHEPGFRLR